MKNNGFIVLMFVIVISLTLLLLGLSRSQGIFSGAQNIFNTIGFEQSKSLAHSCADEALLKLAEDPTYIPGKSGDKILFKEGQCDILSISTSSNIYTIKTSGNSGNAFSTITLTATFFQNSFSISSEVF